MAPKKEIIVLIWFDMKTYLYEEQKNGKDMVWQIQVKRIEVVIIGQQIIIPTKINSQHVWLKKILSLFNFQFWYQYLFILKLLNTQGIHWK